MRATFIAATLMLIGCPIGDQCFAEEKPSPTIALTKLSVVGTFADETNSGKPAVDMSGISCFPLNDDPRTCLLVNNENKNAQFATLANNQLTVGKIVPLIGDTASPSTLGTAPSAASMCSKDGGFKELDGEGVTYADSYFYIVGSHGCTRGSGSAFLLSSFILARVGSNPDKIGPATTTYRVSDLMQHAKAVKSYFGENLNSADGLNIEGIAANDGKLWFGLRAPVVGTQAYVVSSSLSDLFRPDNDQTKVEVDIAGIDLGGLGIRDLAPLPKGRLLILAGPPQSQNLPFKLYMFDPKKGTMDLGTLATVTGSVNGKTVTGHAEGIALLEIKSKMFTFVVVFDGLENGDPHSGEVDLSD